VTTSSGAFCGVNTTYSNRDGFRESIIRLRVKIDNGLEKPN